MRKPNSYDQPAEGGVEVVESALRKQAEQADAKKPVPGQKDRAKTPGNKSNQNK